MKYVLWENGAEKLAQITSCDVLRDLLTFVQLKNMKNTHGGLLPLVKLQATKSETPPWVFSHFLISTNATKSRNASQLIIGIINELRFN